MKKLIQGIVDFRANLTAESRALFAQLALGQKPDSLFIACSDSRVVPNLFASTNPGDLFVLRNIGNLIPPATSAYEEASAQAAIEYSIFSLNIADIIICGHSECGAIKAIMEGFNDACCPHLGSWLKHGREAAERVEKGMVLDATLSKVNQISQMNVLVQMEHIQSYPFVQERVAEKSVRIHGWWFDIAAADVYCYEPTLKHFVLIDAQEAKVILKRLQHS